MKKKISKKEILLLVALEKELPKAIVNDFNVLFTGIGKLNAAFSIFDGFLNYKPKLIINYGTAGAINKSLSGLVKITSFLDLKFNKKNIIKENKNVIYKNPNIISTEIGGYSCSSSDNVVTNSNGILSDLVDMEAYVYAKFCQKYKIKFHCYKFVSDYANDKTLDEWSDNLKYGAKLFEKKLIEICKIYNIS